MNRVAPTLLVVALLAGSAGAFAFTERLKLERSPIAAVDVDKTFSPTCRCAQEHARIAFRLRRPDRVTVQVVDDGGDVVRTLARHEQLDAVEKVFLWNGRDDGGRIIPDGFYRPRIRLEERRRTFQLRNRIRLDTVRPTIVLTRLTATGSAVHARYHVSEPAQAFLLVDGARAVTGRGARAKGKLDWFGRIRGRALVPGRYDVQLVAVDPAGNRSRPTRPVAVDTRGA